MGAWDKVSEKIAASAYFLGLGFITNRKVTLKVPAISVIAPLAEPGTGVVQERDPLGEALIILNP